MIKAIITDVDGVIVGKKLGVNYPLPNKIVINKLNELHKKGIPVILCTGKFGYAVHKIIKSGGLRNPHITDGGALIIDLLSNKIIAKHVLDTHLAEKIIKSFLDKNVYVEMYGADEYFVQKSQTNDFTNKREVLLQKEPKIIGSLSNQIPNWDVVKIMGFVENEKGMIRIDEAVKNLKNKVNFIWSGNAAILPVRFCVITVKGVSKKQAALEVLKSLGISPDETLGIGDLLSDWNFIELCKYAATAGDESQELKELVKKKGEGNYFHGSSVDENGFIEIINHFQNILTPVVK